MPSLRLVLPSSLVLLWLSPLGCRGEGTKEGDDSGGPPAGEEDADGDGFSSAEDCDDADGSANPGAAEGCDGVDNDCDGQIDEGVTSSFYGDLDGDGFGDPALVAAGCEAPSGYVSVPNDCDDRDADSYPGAAERCDGADNDCDGDSDEEVLSEWYADADGDGYGAAGSAYAVCDPPPGYVSNSDDCDDTDRSARPGGAEVCDEADNDCDGDTDEGVTTTYYQDFDGDGFGLAGTTTDACDQPTGYAARSGDCDDSLGSISPNAAELCDGIDNDCDGYEDESTAADAGAWYRDADADGYGSATSTARACTQPSGYADNDEDCDDGDAGVSPADPEVCDGGTDNDCDGEVDESTATDAGVWYADNDGDGYGGSAWTKDCVQPSDYAARSGDCDDGDSGTYPTAAETCDAEDNDCDGGTDEGVTSTFYADDDGDGQGDPASTAAACAPPAGYVSTARDCDDTDASISPNAPELCDSADNDCDGDSDEGAVDMGTWYLDGDGDGYGGTETSAAACDQPSGYVDNAEDCDDEEAAAGPDAEEVADGIDNDCDGEGLHGTYSATSSTSLAGGVWEFTRFTIGAAATVTATGGDPLEIYVLGAAVIDGEIDMAGEDGISIQDFDYSQPGGAGGGGGGGDGGDGGYYYSSASTAPSGSGDAPGAGGYGHSAGSGGGGGGQASAGSSGGASGGCYTSYAGGSGGAKVNSASSPSLIPGSGGGGGGWGTGYNSDGGGGGGGGGAMYLAAESIDIDGEIYCYGGDGGGSPSTDGDHAGGGGGGSGGALWLVGDSVSISGTIRCDGGSGGVPYYAGHCGIAGSGGGGAGGLIYIDTDSVSVTGSVSPGYYVP